MARRTRHPGERGLGYRSVVHDPCLTSKKTVLATMIDNGHYGKGDRTVAMAAPA
jgi:hypothetical protein